MFEQFVCQRHVFLCQFPFHLFLPRCQLHLMPASPTRPAAKRRSVPGSGTEFPPPVKQVELVLSTSEEQNWKVSTARTLRPGEVDVGGIQSWAAALLHQTIVAPS